MTVKELIAILQRMKPEAELYVGDSDGTSGSMPLSCLIAVDADRWPLPCYQNDIRNADYAILSSLRAGG